MFKKNFATRYLEIRTEKVINMLDIFNLFCCKKITVIKETGKGYYDEKKRE